MKEYYPLEDIQIISSLNFDFNLLLKRKIEIRNKFVKEKRCLHCYSEKIKSGETVLTCQHIKDHWNCELSYLNKRIDKKLYILVIRRLKRIGKLKSAGVRK
jgi:hypothetical protein